MVGEKATEKFKDWYKAHQDDVFDFQKELREYCDSDVDILRRACIALREQFLEIANVDPFRYMTLPSVCMSIFRSKYLKPNTLAVFEDDTCEQYSKSSITWLKSFENTNIRCATQGGEAKICGAKVDGYDKTTKTVYQYHGCFWHGCPKCYTPNKVNTKNKQRMSDLYKKTLKRSENIKKAGYNLVEIWECDWLNSPLYKTYKNIEVIEPIKSRDAYYGGRVEAFKLKATSTENTQINYIDVCSLYPTVMFYDNYPIGHPVKYFNPPQYNPKWFGVIKCKILPPNNLHIPVLPTKVKMEKSEKLVFPLCKKCAENQQRNCNHNESERALTGTWSTVEVAKALEKGYKMLNIYEVWHFEASNNIFKDYIRDFMKIKLESSAHSYPSDEEYVKDILDRQGIALDLENIKTNPVKRNLSKLCMNSLYGKFGQRNNISQTEFITEPSRFYEILLDESIEINNTFFISEELIQVNFTYKNNFVENSFNTNVMIALYTTANARLRLFEVLDELGMKVIYCDTDSVVYICTGNNKIKTGDLLGEWTDELKGAYIKKFVTIGPKTYYFITNEGKECTKAKGFRLHNKNAKLINGQVFEQMIDKEVIEVKTENTKICRDRLTKQLINEPDTKRLFFNFDKRIICDDYNTKPYGFI
ncbi:uncharacterized protein LOC135837206 [Planococcus citri]|uniref:uncharacterized protein LOC135837206 n=1 Tax=Planococcus citri TaxID=170843 RepID=UPI0031F741EE